VWVYMYMERSDGPRADADSYTHTLRLNNLGMRPQENGLGMESLTDRAQCMQMSSIDMGLDYDSIVMLTCKLLFLTATICHVSPDMSRQS